MDVERALVALRDLTERTAEGGESGLGLAMAEWFRMLDSHLSSGGNPPEEWVEGPDAPAGDYWGWQDEERLPPEGFTVFAHWSKVHEGVNVEMDVPDGLRVTVQYNEWLAVDSVAGVDANDGTPLPVSE
jgi:hypothetical protein